MARRCSASTSTERDYNLRNLPLRVWSAAVAFLACAFCPLQAQDTTAINLRLRIDQLERTGQLVVAGTTIRRSPVLRAVYERSGYTPVWNNANAAQLIRALTAVGEDGLQSDDYHRTTIERLSAASARASDLDLLRTDALIRIAYDLRRGKTDPATSRRWREYSGPLRTGNPAAEIHGLITGGSLYDHVIALRPNHFVYQGLVDALRRLRGIEAAGGWSSIPEGTPLRRDSSDVRVPLLRHRLTIEGDLASAGHTSLQFDAELETALKKFQHRHGLNEDGVAGSATLAQLNVPVAVRIDQVRANLERARWVTHDLPGTFVVVNVAGAKVYFIREGEVAFETRAVVGKTYTATPVFRATLRTIELNPTWTVPPGIVQEILTAIRRNPSYLSTQNMRVFTRAGREVDRTSIDYSKYTGRSFPYVFRQDPGPLNPLGRIKLLFPNRYNVYLHDTPSRGLFDREERMFSHGCIRVQEPVTLAALVLNDSVNWSPRKINAAIDEQHTRTVVVDQPIPVLILYWTASADLHGELHFYRDVYGRDAALLRALNGN